MFRKKQTWIILTILFVISLVTAFNLFKTAFPILNIDLQMSRQDAFDRATTLSGLINIGPSDYNQAATFGSDNEAQNYIELDAGGSKAFIEMLEKDIYKAYTWKVRHYKENQINEAWFVFSPEGELYGFEEKLSEDLFLESLSGKKARKLAESESAETCNIDFTLFELIEESEDIKTSERLDRTFVYKRNDYSIGEEGEYRLKLVVSGNKLTAVEHYVKVPETFNRKYEEMRSFNNTIASIANYGLLIFYVLGGIVAGLFILNRQKWLLWKTAIYWALFISVVQVISGLNFLPLSWLGYDTAVSTQNFLLQQILYSLIGGIVDFILVLLSFVAAESLTRKAFPDHVQFWKLWSGKNAYTSEVLGRTMGGYLLIGLDLLFVIVFYMITANYFGWWVPTSTLFHPDMIATPFPWLSAVGMSLHAGFWEECLFRAVPLAGAVLIGRKYGNAKVWLISAMLLQALIFAGAHANYPSYPPYSRLVELIIPSLFWGFIYLRFGLLPVIISHFGYDVVWFSLPIFTSSSSDLMFDKIMVFVLTLIPAWVILRAKFKSKTLTNIDISEYNKAFEVEKEEISDEVEEVEEKKTLTVHKNYKRHLYIGAIVLVIAVFAGFKEKIYSNLNLEIKRSEAIALSEKYLNENNINLKDDIWTSLSNVYTGKIDSDDKFIWQEEGPDIYTTLIGSYMDNVMWNIRYVKFEGDVNDKTEEYSVLINPDGSLNQIRHKIPENQEGARLKEKSARNVGLNYIQNRFNLSLDDIEEVSAEISNLPNRDDWTFIFSNNKTQSLKDGDLRIKVNISGDKVTSFNRYVHLPEEWEREEKNDATFAGMVRTFCYFSLVFFILYAAAASIARWSKGKFNFRFFKCVFSILAIFTVLNMINNYPALIADFSSAKPFMNQIIMSIGGSFLFGTIFAFIIAAISGNASLKVTKPAHVFNNFDIIALSIWGISIITFSYSLKQISPFWVSGAENANVYLPVLGYILSNLFSYFDKFIILMFVLTLLNDITDFNRKKKFLSFFLPILFIFLLVGIDFGSGTGVDNTFRWLYITIFYGGTLAAVYVSYIRYDMTVIPLLVAMVTAAELLAFSNTGAYPGILVSNVLSAVLIISIGYWVRLYLLNKGNS